MLATSLTFASPAGAVLCGVALVPLCVLAVTLRRNRRAASVLGLAPAGSRPALPAALAAAGVCALLGIAAAQPVLQTTEQPEDAHRLGGDLRRRRVPVDGGRPRRAAPTPGSSARAPQSGGCARPSRRSRPVSRASPTACFRISSQRPTSRSSRKRSAVRSGSQIAAAAGRSPRSPPRSAALPALVDDGFFSRGAERRTCVVVTDGESVPFSAARGGADSSVGHGAAGSSSSSVGSAAERVFRPDGTPRGATTAPPPTRAPTSTASRPPRADRPTTEDQLDAAGAALRAAAVAGPEASSTEVSRAAGTCAVACCGGAARARDRPRGGTACDTLGYAGRNESSMYRSRPRAVTRRAHRPSLRRLAAAAAVLLGVPLLASAAGGAPAPSGDWLSFGRTTDNMRHSPLTQITPANVVDARTRLHVDFQRLDPDIRRGQQSYPLAIGGRLYVTTNDANVFALDGDTGQGDLAVQAAEQRRLQELRHRRQPRPRLLRRQALHRAARHEARRAPAERRQRARHVASISNDVRTRPRTTATRRRAHRSARTTGVVIGAAGSEYGIRGFVMAYTTDLKPAWPSAVLDGAARPAVVAPLLAGRRRRRCLDAGHDRRDHEHRLLRHRLRRRRSTSRASARARTRGRTR